MTKITSLSWPFLLIKRDVKEKQDIQTTSFSQIGIVLAFIALIFLTAYEFNDNFSKKPGNLWVILKSAMAK